MGAVDLTLSVLSLRYLWDIYIECPVGKWRNEFSKVLSLRNLDSKAPQAIAVISQAQNEHVNDYQKMFSLVSLEEKLQSERTQQLKTEPDVHEGDSERATQDVQRQNQIEKPTELRTQRRGSSQQNQVPSNIN